MKDQTQYNKALILGQGFVAFNYIVITCMIYLKVGNYVTSPALGSAGTLIKKICYGISLPGLIVSCFFWPIWLENTAWFVSSEAPGTSRPTPSFTG